MRIQDYVKSGAVVKETHTRSEEHADAKKRAINHYSEQSLINISQSPDVKSQKGDFEDYAKKKEKKLGQTRAKTNNIHKDEVTDEPLKGNGEFHHKNKKTIFTDPRNRLSPDAGILVNKETHIDIHQNDINDEKALSEYIDNRKKKDIVTNNAFPLIGYFSISSIHFISFNRVVISSYIFVLVGK